MLEQQKAVNLPPWWSGDVEKTSHRLREEINRRNFSSQQKDSILLAMKIANKYHEHQTRANGEKYVVHPYRAALSMLIEFEDPGYENTTAALLHDLLEDTAYTRPMMKEDFGEKVETLVATVSRGKDEKRPKQGDRITDHYFLKIIKAGPDAIKLKMADKLDNIRDALNHPNPGKRALYVRECQIVFLPLLEHLGNPDLGKKIHRLFEEAMLNHPSYLEQILLFNPSMEYWLTSDDIRRVKIPLSPGFTAIDLVKSVAAAVIDRINRRLETLFYIANLPIFLKSPGKKKSWERVKNQLNLLIELLTTNTPPPWLKPLLEIGKPGYLLAVIHSRLFMPANWLFPLWQEDYGLHIFESNKELYLAMNTAQTGDTGKWLARLHLLLLHREALWRSITGNGVNTAQNLLAQLQEAARSMSQEEYPLLLSMRLVAEYLDVSTDPGIPRGPIEEKFAELWAQLKDPAGTYLKTVDSKVEIAGFEETREICPTLETPLTDLRRILEEKTRGTSNQEIEKETVRGKSPLAWINFNVTEIRKRLTFFREALKKIRGHTTYEDLEEMGIHVQEDRLENVLVYTVEPDKGDALKNRVPEVTGEERSAIRAGNYTAEAIFDTLLKNKLEKPEKEPLWIPRVYRILDTMADFDPHHVQAITISFQAEEEISDVKVYHPLPGEKSSPDQQKKRKEITARYLVTMIYNHVVTLGIHAATVDCAPLEKQREHLGFKNPELENMLGKLAEKLNFENQYSRYVEKFNFKKFSIRSAPRARRPVTFTAEDISYGLFLGIDIGGTDTKVSLFSNGDIAIKEEPLLKFSTFDPAAGFPYPAQEFCKRIIAKVDAYLKGWGKYNWENLEGVGISWTGGVKNSRIVTYSVMLQKLSFAQGEKIINIKPESSPLEVHTVDLAGVFYQELSRQIETVNPSIVVALENDGNAEAYGNYCYITKNGNPIPGGKLIIKLGTSTAGGYVHLSSALSPLVTEFAKIVLDFNIEEKETREIQGPVREFVSSIAVRKLSRTFQFNGESVFGKLACACCQKSMNENDTQKTRIEAIEIGKLLDFFAQLREPQLKEEFLKELVETDNRNAKNSTEKLAALLTRALQDDRPMREMFNRYIKERGAEEYDREYKEDSKKSKTDALLWELGIYRVRHLFSLNPTREAVETGQVPGDFDIETISKKILGAVALFSQVALHISHLVVTLYNIFKKERFNEVILSGGVLRGETGRLMVKQAEAFMAKYYDKIFGPQKHLKPGSIRQAEAVENPDSIGPLGAAMVANRLHKINSQAEMEKEIDYRVKQLKPGETILIEDLQERFAGSRVKKEEIREYLEMLISEAILLPRDIKKEAYVKAFIPE